MIAGRLSRTLWPIALMVSATACASAPPPEPCPPAPTVAPPPTAASAVPAPTAPSALDQATVPPRPDWTDKYADENVGDMRFLDIDGLMKAQGLSRALAVEVQNHFRDQSRAGSGDPDAWFAEALKRAKAGQFEDGRDIDALKKAPFIVVFDLDETLYDQYYPSAVGKACHDLAFTKGKKPRYVHLAPGGERVIGKVVELGGAVVIFSANTDERTYDNLRAWKLDGKALPDHPSIDGVLTNSHLVLRTKQHGNPVVEPSKDLRIFDESLERVIIVDDNPARLFQFRNVRASYPFDAEAYCQAKKGDDWRRAMEATLRAVEREITDADAYRRAKNVPFVTAYLPYSMHGRRAVEAAMAAGKTRAQAIAWVREHPEVVDD